MDFKLCNTWKHLHRSLVRFEVIGSGVLRRIFWSHKIALRTSLKYLLTVWPERMNSNLILRFFWSWPITFRNIATFSSNTTYLESVNPTLRTRLQRYMNVCLFTRSCSWQWTSLFTILFRWSSCAWYGFGPLIIYSLRCSFSAWRYSITIPHAWLIQFRNCCSTTNAWSSSSSLLSIYTNRQEICKSLLICF